MLEFGTAHAIRDVPIFVPTFPFPLTSPSEILLRKELQTMALLTKSWPRVLSITKHIEFPWVLFYRFVFFPHSGKPSIEYLPLARALAIGKPYALGTILLASLYQSIGKYVSELPYQRVEGALWFVQIWLFAYFPKLSGVDSFPSMSLGLSATQSIRTISSDSLSSFFIGLVDRSLSQVYLKPDTISSPT